ncbi:MAG TPA: cysteine peptidase family C39 domain-containing protein [Rhodocyclaceae bacterium]
MSMDLGISPTAILCLAAVAQYRGLATDPEQLMAEYRRGGPVTGAAAVTHLASCIGLHGELGQADWGSVMAGQHAFPLLARLKNDNWVVIVGTRNDEVERVAIVDPLEPALSVFLLQREQFCSQWEGAVVLLSPAQHTEQTQQAPQLVAIAA